MRDIPFRDVLQPWRLEFARCLPGLAVAGSPERSLFRTVIEDSEERRFLLEEIRPATLDRRREIAVSVEVLATRGVPCVFPYLRNGRDDVITRAAGSLWQLSPFVEGVELERPGYTRDEWRGRALARFLVEMRKVSFGIPSGDPSRSFSIEAFTSDLMRKMSRFDPEQAGLVRPAFVFLEERLFPLSKRLPVAFCHGDFHPLNVIWGEDGIRAVIDWEFSGYKPEIYDAALLLGCIGMEDPESLGGSLVLSFLEEVRASGCFDPSGFTVLPEFVLAVRFGWLSDWLRKKDAEMVELETYFINVLLDNLENLRLSWRL
ncbi:MAG TPA: phosphotransferase [Syntrophales bacterium]|nr:phosphotransferase [Syntrophales bacterium]HRT62622.1 phosphotransferase [Syntrophales bacterium]